MSAVGSRSSWRSGPRASFTSRTYDLPYRWSPRATGSAGAVCRVAERAEQERHVVVLLGALDGELDGDLGEERARAGGLEVGAGVEAQPVAPRRFRRAQ